MKKIILKSLVIINCNCRQGSYLTAEGGEKNGQRTPSHDYEWQFSFTKAEELLINKLEEQHLRCRVGAHLIFQHFLASTTIITKYHIDTVFLTLVEENYIEWRDVTLGEKVLWSLFHFYLARNEL